MIATLSILYVVSLSFVVYRFWSRQKPNSLKAVSHKAQSVVAGTAGDLFYSDMKDLLNLENTQALEELFESNKSQWEIDLLKQSLHDLRSPLLALIQIHNEITHGNPAFNVLSEDLLDQVSTQIRSTDQLIDDGTVTFRKADIVRCITRSVQTVSLLKKHIQIQLDLCETSFRALHSASLLERAIINLLENATEHAKHCVIVGFKADRRNLVISVEDDGPGVQIPYRFRAGQVYSSHGNRGALGLASVQHIAHKHGGKLYYKSSPLGGAKFEIALEVI